MLVFSLFYLPVFQGGSLIQAKVQPPSDKSGTISPISSFIQLERYNAIHLVQFVHASLAGLSKVIRGTSLLTSEVQSLASSLLKQEVSTVSPPIYPAYAS